jgi:hypothetical protein
VRTLKSQGSNLVALALVAVVVTAGAGYWFLTPKILNEPASTVQYTSLLTPSERSQTSTESTILASATTVASATTAWLNISATQPVSHYLSLLESNGTQPYVQLARELQKIPGLTNATAVAKITYLALNASNPEVKEAFELMIKGGTPDPHDFAFTVPAYNTELEVLYWLACQSEFKKDDTLALAVAMVNGFWVTVGDEQVREGVKKDTNELLNFFRGTNEMQKARGYPRLEDYPLEAKICLVWTGNIAPNFSAFPVLWGHGEANTRILGYLYNKTRLDSFGYDWNTVSVKTLTSMREEAIARNWNNRDYSTTVEGLEHFFYLDSNSHWMVGHSAEWGPLVYVPLGGKLVRDYIIGNVDAMYDYYSKHGKGVGTCNDQSAWTDAWAKSLGIATTIIWIGDFDGQAHHFLPTWFDPVSRTWRATYEQFLENLQGADSLPLHLMFFRPPVNLGRYFNTREQWLIGNSPNIFYWYSPMITLKEIEGMFLPGLSPSEMKQWLLYS